MAAAAIIQGVAALGTAALNFASNNQAVNAQRDAQLQDRRGVDELEAARDFGGISYAPVLVAIGVVAVAALIVLVTRKRKRG